MRLCEGKGREGKGKGGKEMGKTKGKVREVKGR